MSRLVFLVVLICMALPGNSPAKMLDVEADEMVRIGQRIEAYGNVVLTGDDLTLRADYVVYDTSTQDIWATGDCFMKEAKGEVSAEVLSYNAKRKDLHVENGTIFGYSQAVKISGESITRYGEDYITGTSVEFTHCLGTPPDWSIKASRMEIPVGGYGSADDARFLVRSWPLLRMPYLVFPADLTRHSGMLIPEMGHSSDYGYHLSQPVFVTLGRSADWTVTPTWLTQRGLLVQNEMRYSLDYDRNGLVYFETLHDRLGDEKSDAGGVIETIPTDRWFFKAVQGGEDLSWDINLVSTPDYFRDIGTFYDTGSLKNYTSAGAGNQLDDSNLTELISRVQWVKSYNWVSLSLSGQFKQDLTESDNGDTIQEVPRFTARVAERGIPYTPLKASAEVSSTRVETLNSIGAFKDNAQAQISWPITLFRYFTFRPYLNEMYRDTLFSETKDLYGDDTYQEHWEERGASLSTTLYSSRFADGLYHQMVPTLSFRHFSRIGGNYDVNDPDDIFPQLITGDDWEKDVNTGVGLSNYLRNDQGASLADLSADVSYSYVTDRWEDITVRGNLYPAPWLSASHTNIFSRTPGRAYATSEHSTRLSLVDPRGDMLTAGMEYHRPDADLLTAGIQAKLVKGLMAGIGVKYDFIEHVFDEQTQALIYNSQCWSLLAERRVENRENDAPSRITWSLKVKLLGMGDLMGNVGAARQ